jgi:hypothetical protein
MRISGHGIRVLVLAAIAAAGAQSAPADELKWLGAHAAYYSQYDKVALGINARQDLGEQWSAGFLFDCVLRGHIGETWATSADLQWERSFARPRIATWIGGGGGVLRDDLRGPNQKAQYEPFAVGFVGVGLDGHPVMPYVEMRFMSHQVFHGVVYAGLRF